ncbi:thioredoxin-like domain-containing protein [Cohnella cholangitidis]|uniref:TlpA family protein disulfide reductase n=1 Tax=Cohnella cholangitidis TaxID=2598458 RepID=A0A7G5C2V0_9BACL|nr:thioredoxin-like domain-containing protein [Cohnella cholangitidis]QMV43534.1 hypothetical protein FPL14_21895 [Cohnella cholangitidis]
MDFKTLFKKAPKPPETVETLQPDQPFPLNWRSLLPREEAVIVAVISLYCSHCIELLPELTSIVHRDRIPFILVSNGTTQENENIAAYFKAEFPFVSIEEEDILEVYKVNQTPYFYLVDGRGLIVKGFAADSAEDVATHWRQREVNSA